VTEGQPPGDPTIIPRERAERIARAHACLRCKEYSYRKVAVKPSTAALREALGEVWHALLVCGVCGTTQELGIDADGDVVYAG
jgi:transcription elongation factor Elf1